MSEEMATVDDAIDVLNDALKRDSDAISALIGVRIECNDDLGDHPTIQVSADEEGDPPYEVGVLGLINGIFGASEETGYGYIMAEVDDEDQIVEFMKTPESYLVAGEPEEDGEGNDVDPIVKHGSGEILEEEGKTAASEDDQEWTDKDEEELEEETQS